MKLNKKIIAFLFILILSLIMCKKIYASTGNVEFKGTVTNNEGYEINTYFQEEIYYLFLPKDIDISQLKIKYNCEGNIASVNSSTAVVDTTDKTITDNFVPKDTMVITMQDGKSYTLKVIQSDIPSIMINNLTLTEKDAGTGETVSVPKTLNDLIGGSKDVRYKSRIQVSGAENEEQNFVEDNTEIKGRGNSTWEVDKKPFQIKLNTKRNLLGIGSGESKTWILLANYYDKSLMRNKIMNDLQRELLPDTNLNSKFVDLYIDGEYLGNYLLCEKIQIGQNRVNLQNKYGVLAEIDLGYAEGTDDPKFRTDKTKGIFVIKETYAEEELKEQDLDNGETIESVKQEAIELFKADINKFEDLIYAENPDWNQISKMIDVESFVNYYFLIELAEDLDRFLTSTYLYKDGPDDVIHIGPVWDSDHALGYFSEIYPEYGAVTTTDYTLWNPRSQIKWYTQLYRNKEFATLLNKNYKDNIKNVFSTIPDKLDSYKNSMVKSSEMNYIRWKEAYLTKLYQTEHECEEKTYAAEVNYLKNWLTNRVSYMNKRYGDTYEVVYTTRNKGTDWETSWKMDEEISGVEERKMQQLKIVMPNSLDNEHIKYSVYEHENGWQDFVSDGEIAGFDEKNIEAVKIKLENMDEYDVLYSVYSKNSGWSEWIKNGEEARVDEQYTPIEMIKIKVSLKDTEKNPPNVTEGTNGNTQTMTPNEDNTKATTDIPNAGQSTFIFILIGVCVIVAIVSIIRYKGIKLK